MLLHLEDPGHGLRPAGRPAVASRPAGASRRRRARGFPPGDGHVGAAFLVRHQLLAEAAAGGPADLPPRVAVALLQLTRVLAAQEERVVVAAALHGRRRLAHRHPHRLLATLSPIPAPIPAAGKAVVVVCVVLLLAS